MLLPVAVLVFLILGALAVDYSSAWSAERELSSAAGAAANDAVSRSIDLDRLYATGEVRLLADVAARVAEASVQRAGLDRLDARVTAVQVTGLTVQVTVRGRAHYLFSHAVPGGPEGVDVEVTSVVTAKVPGS
jgi:Flp pilus assembly protein TadG